MYDASAKFLVPSLRERYQIGAVDKHGPTFPSLQPLVKHLKSLNGIKYIKQLLTLALQCIQKIILLLWKCINSNNLEIIDNYDSC